MFDTELDALATSDLLERAAGCRATANQSDAELLECAQIYADRYHSSTGRTRPGRHASDGREQAVVLGGDGCPNIAEFAVAEFAVVIGVSPGAGRDLIADALALRHRFPRTWAQVQAGAATPWKARLIVHACTKLDQPAAGYVDRRVAGVVDTISPYRLDKVIRAARMQADPELARAEAEEKARERGVFVGSSNEHGTKTMYIKASSGAVTRLDARIDAVADALKIVGDTRKLQHRRAEAVDIITDARYTEELLTQARDFQHRARPAAAQTPPEPTSSAPDSATTTSRPDRCGEDLPTDRTGIYGDEYDSDEEAGSLRRGQVGEQFDATDPSDPSLGEPANSPGIRYPESLDPTDPLGPLDRRAGTGEDVDKGQPLDAAAQRALDARLAQIKRDAYTNPRSEGQVRPGQTEVYVHLTDHTLATGTGVLRAETIGPLLASQLTELIGHGPYTVKPVIDLNDAVSVNAYEIPTRIRERIKLIHPVELFPYGTRETSQSIDLDHIEPYDTLGPPGQTSTGNLAPLSRFGHRVKTFAHGWSVRRIDYKTLEWRTPHGFKFQVDPTGTRQVKPD